MDSEMHLRQHKQSIQSSAKTKQSIWAEEIETLIPQVEVWCRKEEHSFARFNLGSSGNHSGGCQHEPGAWIYVPLRAV